MAVDDPDIILLTRHLDTLNKGRRHLEKLDLYLEGKQPLNFVAPELYKELGDHVVQMVINWPRLAVDAYENRLDLQGFRFPDADDADDELWGIWQDNDLVEGSQQAHTEAIGLERAYAIIGAREEDGESPLISVEHPLQVTHANDPRKRDTSSAAKTWVDDDKIKHGTLYKPNETRYYIRDRGAWILDPGMENPVDQHDMGVVPVVPLVNRGRILKPYGVSEFQDILTIADAANKMATDMMISGEFHAMPRRWVFGMGQDEFQDRNGNAVSSWSAIAGRLWATKKKPADVKAGQFDESDLVVFHNTLRVLAQLASQLLALPPHYMAFASDNPTSADAIDAAEAQLVKRCKRKQTTFGSAWVRVMQIALRVRDGRESEKARRLQADWRDPETPTKAQMYDAMVKAVTGGVLPVEGAWDEMGFSSQRKARLRRQFQEQRDAEMDMVIGNKPPIDDPDPQPDPDPTLRP